MKKERLYILVYINNEKILIRNIKNILEYKQNKKDLFIYVREEVFFGENGIKELKDYFDIPNLEELKEEKAKKIFYTPYITPLNVKEFLKTTTNTELYKHISELYNFFIKNTNEKNIELIKNLYEKEIEVMN